ncbi:DUF1642 domain-containing protein [Streptococcus hyovaginalis]
MNKQEAIDAICNLKTNDGWVNRYAVVSIVDQIEPEKPVVPQFVADWIELSKASGFSLRLAMEHWKMDENTEKWMAHSNNQETFARAWLDGYEVEQEKLYYVNIPNVYHGDFGYSKEYDNYSFYNKSDATEIRFELTESEIKAKHEWAWKWAKPVEVGE